MATSNHTASNSRMAIILAGALCLRQASMVRHRLVSTVATPRTSNADYSAEVVVMLPRLTAGMAGMEDMAGKLSHSMLS